jgi:hypothetical protein
VPRHPIFDAVFEKYWKDRDIDPGWVRDMAAGRTPTSRAFAEAMRLDLGVPIGAWPKLEPEYPLRKSALPLRTHSVTIDSEMQDSAIAPSPRRGPALKSEGPVALAARNSGKSMFEVAADLGVSYGAAKAWNRRKSAPVTARRALARSPYRVPASAWG